LADGLSPGQSMPVVSNAEADSARGVGRHVHAGMQAMAWHLLDKVYGYNTPDSRHGNTGHLRGLPTTPTD
jgi:hypothetical protein